jgi:uncharacterized membrane protein YdjX (TVP38/TMEM64 family)
MLYTSYGQFKLMLYEQRRALVGGALMIGAFISLILFFPELQGVYNWLLLVQQYNFVLFCSVFVGLLVVACLTNVVPASILGVMAGAFFGVLHGFVLSAGAFLLAAVIAFLFGRFFFRAACKRLASKAFDLEKLEISFARHGWQYAILLRLAPLAPFGLTSYGLGLTPISFKQYILTTLGSLPFLFVCVYVGRIGGGAIHQGGAIDRFFIWELMLSFTVITGIVAIMIYFLRRLLGNGKSIL